MNTETTNEARIESLEIDFYDALEQGDIESADQVITFLAEAKEYTKAIELLPVLAKAKMMRRMVLPKGYGHEGLIKERPLTGSAFNTKEMMDDIVWGDSEFKGQIF